MSNETIDNLLNFDKVFNSKLIDIKKAFISFYGVENAEFINERLSSITTIGYLKPSNLSCMMSTVRKNINGELIQKFFALSGIEDNEVNRKLFMSDNISYRFNTPIGKYSIIANMNENDPGYDTYKQYANTFTTNLFGKCVVDLTEEEKEYLSKLCNIYENLLVEYESKMEKYKPYVDYINSSYEIENKTKKKYLINFIEEYSYLLSDAEIEVFENYKNDDTKTFLGLSSPYFNAINIPGSIESFSDANLAILKKDKTSMSAKIVKSGQLKFFQTLGIDLGEDFENNPKYIEAIPKLNELANEMIEKRKKLEKECMSEYYSSLPEYKSNDEKLRSKNFCLKDQLMCGYDYEENKTCIIANAINDNGKIEVAPILLFACGFIQEYSDARLIHELNHAFELTIKEISSDKIDFICGWDTITGYVDEREPDYSDRVNREYELYNEIINELISQEITAILHQQGKYIFNNEKDAKIKGATSYEHSLFIIKDFYDTYKDIIIESRKNSNINILLNKVGKENFIAMNKLFFDFNENFGGNKYYKLANQLKTNMDTEETRLYYQFVERRDEIIRKMNEYSLEKDDKIVA